MGETNLTKELFKTIDTAICMFINDNNITSDNVSPDFFNNVLRTLYITLKKQQDWTDNYESYCIMHNAWLYNKRFQYL